ncbi:MlaA family lipoprotein [Nitrospira japonica]|uniref:MlaA family lipoprotein n=1 Tax=Nitrospira japonica TaxID=1325564 RepID=UPI0012DF7DC9|nr:VacJ family lipoprotein [Nitrospira japonica]
MLIRRVSCVLGLVLIVTSGCAELEVAGTPRLTGDGGLLNAVGAMPPDHTLGSANGPAADGSRDIRAAAETSPPVSSREPAEEIFDPFAKSDEVTGEDYDPWEPVNTKIFEFNRQMDRYVLKPVAQGYDFIVPDLVQIGVGNIFYNFRFVPRFLNNVFQGKVKGASIEVGRFILNSTVGIGGFFDLAQDVNLVTPEEDLGQTLGFYGVKPGPYIVVPFLAPYTLRDLIGYVGDIFLNPINWLFAPIIEVKGVPSVISHPNRNTSTIVQLGARVGEIVNDRSRNLQKFQGVEEATFDLYTAVRNAYLQQRARQIKE